MIEQTVNLLVKCDDCGQTYTFDYEPSNREAAKAARRRGWSVKGKTALCPKHKQIQSTYRQQEHSPRGANAAHHTSPLRTTSHQERA
jgi:hypothetical protein